MKKLRLKLLPVMPNSSLKSSLVIVGRLGRPHGIKGWQRVVSFTDPIENLFNYPSWLLGQDQEFTQSIDYEQWLFQGANLLVKLPGCDTPEQAQTYNNLNIAVPRDSLPKLAEHDYYWTDLEGLRVICNSDQTELGRIDQLFATGSNDVMVVKGDKERLIPFIKSVIVEVNLAQGYVLVDWDKDF